MIRVQWDRVGQLRFHHSTQKGLRFQTYKLLISGGFHLIFLDQGGQQVTKAAECETAHIGHLLYIAAI